MLAALLGKPALKAHTEGSGGLSSARLPRAVWWTYRYSVGGGLRGRSGEGGGGWRPREAASDVRHSDTPGGTEPATTEEGAEQGLKTFNFSLRQPVLDLSKGGTSHTRREIHTLLLLLLLPARAFLVARLPPPPSPRSLSSHRHTLLGAGRYFRAESGSVKYYP